MMIDAFYKKSSCILQYLFSLSNTQSNKIEIRDEKETFLLQLLLYKIVSFEQNGPHKLYVY